MSTPTVPTTATAGIDRVLDPLREACAAETLTLDSPLSGETRLGARVALADGREVVGLIPSIVVATVGRSDDQCAATLESVLIRDPHGAARRTIRVGQHAVRAWCIPAGVWDAESEPTDVIDSDDAGCASASAASGPRVEAPAWAPDDAQTQPYLALAKRRAPAGYTPVLMPRKIYGTQSNPMASYDVSYVPDPAEHAVPWDDIVAAIGAGAPVPVVCPRRSRLVVFSDLQIGKTDSRGGTPELRARVSSALGRVVEIMDADPVADTAVVDGGDLVEGSNSTASQHRTNDLADPSQIVEATSLMTQIVGTVAAHRPGGVHGMRVVAVPSNHAAWRNGRSYLGRPSDDMGLAVHRIVSEHLGTDLVVPGEHDLAVAFDTAAGVRVGVEHGHAVGKIRSHLEGALAAPDHPLAGCDLVVTGHFHSLHVEDLGAGRTWIQAPTIDAGSSWFTAKGHAESAPGALVVDLCDERIEAVRPISAEV